MAADTAQAEILRVVNVVAINFTVFMGFQPMLLSGDYALSVGLAIANCNADGDGNR